MFTKKTINFANISEKNYKGKIHFTIFPVSYEKTTTYGKGTKKGPENILKATPNLEFYDEELGFTPLKKIRIKTLPIYNANKYPPEKAIEKIAQTAKKLLKENSTLITLGGEHSVTIAINQALLEKKQNDITFVQLDAHADLRDKYEGSKYNHACAMRRIAQTRDTIHIGIRAIDEEETTYIKKEKKKIFFAKDIIGKTNWIDKAIAQIKTKKIYLTFDVDAFDAAFMPATGTPEPGGFQWYDTMKFLKKLIRKKEIIAFDIVEFAPIKGFHAYDFTIAKLLYKIISYITHKKLYKKKQII